MNKPRIYLAGPDVFLRKPDIRAKEIKEICNAYFLEGVFPLDAEVKYDNPGSPEHGFAIGRANEELIDSCDGVLANLTPFRGPSADVGTIYEVGYACGKGKVVMGYTFNSEDFFTRTLPWVVSKRQDGTYEDKDNMMIEAFGLEDNLMIPAGIDKSGGSIIKARRHDQQLSVIEWAVQELENLLYSGKGASRPYLKDI